VSAAIGPLLGGLFLVLGIGMVLRRVLGWGATQADVLNTLIVDVTMPALLFVTLARDGVRWTAWQVLPATTTALLTSIALGVVIARVLKLERPAQGSASLVAAFANTGFLGVPLLLAVFPRNPEAASSALMVDVINTTFMLWTLGLAVSERLGKGAAFDARAAAKIFVKPMIIAVTLGAIVHEVGLSLPEFALTSLDVLGHTTSPLVFLSLGLALDLRALKGRLAPVLLLTTVKIVVMPAIAFVVVELLHTREPMATIAVLQCAMPSALATVIVAARAGCDRALAAAVVALTTLISLASLPGWARFIS
jgi:predicted permease